MRNFENIESTSETKIKNLNTSLPEKHNENSYFNYLLSIIFKTSS